MITEINEQTARLIRGKPIKKKTVSDFISDSGFNKGGLYQTLLDRAKQAWDNLSDFRERAQKNVDFFWGNHWNEMVTDPDTGEVMTEETYIRSKGSTPLTQNLVKQVVNNIVGHYISNPSSPLIMARKRVDAKAIDMLNMALRSVYDLNKGDQLDIRLFEMNLLTGMAVQKVTYGYLKDRDITDVKITNVNHNRVFVNGGILDPRMTEINLIGEIIETDVESIVAAFAKTEKQANDIRNIYTQVDDYTDYTESFTGSEIENTDFYIPGGANKVRLYEIWYQEYEWRVWAHDYADGSYGIVPYTLKEIEAMNKERIAMGLENGMAEDEILLIEAEKKYEPVWKYAFITQMGYCLKQGETPYEHQKHPYIITLYPLINGRVAGFVENILQINKYINRLIMQYDFILGASAKGVLLVPETAIDDDSELNRISEQWSKFNGVIRYKVKKGYENLVPKQVQANSINIGLQEMIALQMQLFEKLSGVSPAMKGEKPPSGTPSSLYMQQIQYSMTNIADIMEYFKYFKEIRNTIIVKLIKQYYTEPRYLEVAGKDYSDVIPMYEPEKVKDMEFSIKMTESRDTPIYRAMQEDFLMQLLQGGAIDLELLLKNSSMPFAEQLLDDIKQRKEQIQQGSLLSGGERQQIDPRVAQLLDNVPMD